MKTPYFSEADLRRAGRDQTRMMHVANDIDARLANLENGGDGSPSSDGWPDGYTHERAGSYYTVFDPSGEEIGKVQGQDAAQELAWNDASA